MIQGSKLLASPCSARFMTNFPPCVRQVPCTVLHLPRMVSLRCQTVFPLSGRSSSESRYQSKLLMHQLSCCWRSMEEASQRYMPSWRRYFALIGRSAVKKYPKKALLGRRMVTDGKVCAAYSALALLYLNTDAVGVHECPPHTWHVRSRDMQNLSLNGCSCLTALHRKQNTRSREQLSQACL